MGIVIVDIQSSRVIRAIQGWICLRKYAFDPEVSAMDYKTTLKEDINIVINTSN